MIESLKFDGISFKYPNGTEVLSKASFTIPMNNWVFIRGDLGQGKSTIIKLLLGLMEPSEGKVIFNGFDIHELGFEEFSKFLARIGHVLDDEGLLSNQSLFENLSLPLIYHENKPHDERERWIDELIEKFKLMSFKTARPAFATTETKKIFSILRALVLKPELIIMHNPFKDLGEMNQKRVLSLLEEFQDKYGLKHIIIAADEIGILRDKKMKYLEINKGQVHEL